MIWFDLDNSPHVPLFRPVFSELERRKEQYWITARDFAQTRGLLDFWGLRYQLVGKHGGRNKARKVLNLLYRSSQLARNAHGRRLNLAVSHGSRAQVVAAKLLGLPSVLMLDYEHTEIGIFNVFATYILVPSLIPEKRLAEAGVVLKKVIRYGGFKEQIYLRDFVPSSDFRESIGVSKEDILVTIRPPSVVGNYHNPRSETLFSRCLEYLGAQPGVKCVVVNRTRAEMKLIPDTPVQRSNVKFLPGPVDGLQLLWHSDVVVSGGGTMNREAALLGIPTYSIFAGRKPYLDELLSHQGRLSFLEKGDQIESIPLKKRSQVSFQIKADKDLACEVTDILLDIVKRENS